MSQLKKICEEVLEKREKSDFIVYYTHQHDGPRILYEAVAMNNADKMARALLVLREALEIIGDSRRVSDWAIANDRLPNVAHASHIKDIMKKTQEAIQEAEKIFEERE